MQTREAWPRWASLLRRFHIDQFTAWVLEAGGPLTLLGAQALYFGRSFLGPQWADPLARTLEDEDELHDFIALLQSGQSHD
jgi:hypothetical protein